MNSSRTLYVALLLAASLLLAWTLWPSPQETSLGREAPRAVAKGEAGRRLKAPKPRPVPRHRAAAAEAGSSHGETGAASDGASAPTPERMTRRDRALAKRALARARATAAAVPPAAAPELRTGADEEPYDGAMSGAPPRSEFDPPPDSPFADLTEAELLEYIVALRRLRDSGALRRVPPEDYWRIMEIMPESRGLQDADRIMNEIFGMGIGEWLARHRGPQNFALD